MEDFLRTFKMRGNQWENQTNSCAEVISMPAITFVRHLNGNRVAVPQSVCFFSGGLGLRLLLLCHRTASSQFPHPGPAKPCRETDVEWMDLWWLGLSLLYTWTKGWSGTALGRGSWYLSSSSSSCSYIVADCGLSSSIGAQERNPWCCVPSPLLMIIVLFSIVDHIGVPHTSWQHPLDSAIDSDCSCNVLSASLNSKSNGQQNQSN